jgi:hypothetical protein
MNGCEKHEDCCERMLEMKAPEEMKADAPFKDVQKKV